MDDTTAVLNFVESEHVSTTSLEHHRHQHRHSQPHDQDQNQLDQLQHEDQSSSHGIATTAATDEALNSSVASERMLPPSSPNDQQVSTEESKDLLDSSIDNSIIAATTAPVLSSRENSQDHHHHRHHHHHHHHHSPSSMSSSSDIVIMAPEKETHASAAISSHDGPVIAALETLNSAMASAAATAAAAAAAATSVLTSTSSVSTNSNSHDNSNRDGSTSMPITTAATTSVSSSSSSTLARTSSTLASTSAPGAVSIITSGSVGSHTSYPSSPIASGSSTAVYQYSSSPVDHNNNKLEKCPALFKCPVSEWEPWIEREKTHTRWNLIRHRHRDKQTFARGPTASEWSREYQCVHAGQYRDRRNPDVDPSKKRKRTGSIKCNCPAFIKMRKQFVDEEVIIEYFWKHEGHIPDVMEDIKAHRLPQDLKSWIRRRVEEGSEWKAVKIMLMEGSPLLDELHPMTKENVKSLVQACYGHYANTARLLRKTRESGNALPSSSGSDGTRHPPSNKRTTSSASSPSAVSEEQDRKRRLTTHTGVSADESTTATRRHTVNGNNQPGGSIDSGGGDGQTLAIHSISTSTNNNASGGDGRVAIGSDPSHLQLFSLNESLLSAEALSRAIREQAAGGRRQGQAGSSSSDGGAQGLTGSAASMSGSQSRALRRGGNLSERELAQRQDNQEEGQEEEEAGEARNPRDMMMEMLRAIAELHQQMEEATEEEEVTQEEAAQIIESFVLPIRLMKDALERSRTSR
ncbi:hypothetical protein BGZ98_008059 [Dissophora globulifera]|nr:hypothetical protein BGZ98_008059 [Dissophora globulifera]